MQIIHRTETFCVADKPAGLPTQAPAPHDCLQASLRVVLGLSEGDYLTPVHRLDRCVSGPVLFALTKKAARLLSEQFVSRVVAKTYLAIVTGNPFASTTPGIIDTWTDFIAKIDGEARVQRVNDSSGKEAITGAELVRHVGPANRSLVRLRPKTGRMHQLRIALADRGHPILGDRLYGSEVKLAPAEDGEVIALHAESLTFRDPKTAKWVTCQAVPPLGLFGDLADG